MNDSRTASGELAVETHALTVRYGKRTALDGIDLRVPEGAVYLLAGANGAGKSTAMKALLNMERPSAGRAEVFGLDTATKAPSVRAQIGYIPEQHEHDYGFMPCGRLIDHAAAHYPSWDHGYAVHLIELFGVPLERKAGTLSKGEARRLQFVLALAHRPPLLLLDEPTDGLDPLARSRALGHLAEHLADTPTTVVISTHHIHEVDSLVDHAGVLRGGRLIAQMSRAELQRRVVRYHVEAPEGWQLPAGLPLGARRARGREQQLTLIGDPEEMKGRLIAAGATVRDTATLRLEEAALALMGDE